MLLNSKSLLRYASKGILVGVSLHLGSNDYSGLSVTLRGDQPAPMVKW